MPESPLLTFSPPSFPSFRTLCLRPSLRLDSTLTEAVRALQSDGKPVSKPSRAPPPPFYFPSSFPSLPFIRFTGS